MKPSAERPWERDSPATRLPLRGPLASWLEGEVRLHCAQCHEVVVRGERECVNCCAPLLKVCPQCHSWVELDVTTCGSCLHTFTLPPRSKGTIRLWHPMRRT